MKYWSIFLLLLSIQVSSNDLEKKEFWEYIDGSVQIKFRFKEILNHQFLVKGVWTPDGGAPGFSGPAELIFKDIQNGSVSKINIPYFSLELSNFKDLNLIVTKDTEKIFNPSTNLDKTYLVDYYDLDRMSLWNYKHVWSPAPIFFEDIDLDGKKELITLNWMSGQRFNHEFKLYQINTEKNQTKITPYYPINEEIDSSTEFNRVDKTIRAWHSGGACLYTTFKYKFDGQRYKFVQYIEAKGVDVDSRQQKCHRLIYDVMGGKKILRQRYQEHYKKKSNP